MEPPAATTLITQQFVSLLTRISSTSTGTPPSINGNHGGNKSEGGVLTSNKDEDVTTSTPYQIFVSKLKSPQAADVVKRLKLFIGRTLKRETHEPPDDNVRRGENTEDEEEEENEEDPGSFEPYSQSVRTFLETTERLLRQHPVFAREGSLRLQENEELYECLEKFVMNKLYPKVFSPFAMHKRRDLQLYLKINKLQGGFIKANNLELDEAVDAGVASDETGGERESPEDSWRIAAEEINRINQFRAPQDKLICLLNSCRVLHELVRNARSPLAPPPSADEGLPALVYLLIRANPPKLWSTVQYVAAYHARLRGEEAYYFTQLASAVSFLERADHRSFAGIPREAFEQRMREEDEERQVTISTPSSSSMSPNGDRGAEDDEHSDVVVAAENGTAPTEEEKSQLRGGNEHSVSLGSSFFSSAGSPSPPLRISYPDVHSPAATTTIARSQFRFEHVTSASELRIGEVDELLNEYKALLEIVRKWSSKEEGEGRVSPETTSTATSAFGVEGDDARNE